MSNKNKDADPGLQKAIRALGFKQPTEIQRKSYPVIVSGKDLMASAQTGTGKTAAFTLPVIHNLMKSSGRKGNGPMVLILAPTRELAMQVKGCVDRFTRGTHLKNGLVVGGMGYGPQRKMLKRGVEILVATPGRLKDHMNQGGINFRNLEVLVLDEADRMLDMGFIGDIRAIAAVLPENRQTLLFSATLEGQVMKIAKELTRNPERISLANNAKRHLLIDQHMHFAESSEHKFSLLKHLLSDRELVQAVVFTKTKHGADKLAKKLSNQGFKAAALHGNMSQGKRKRTIDLVKKGKLRFLVATDVAARGLDIDGISHVVNYDMPMVAEDYIHRIGRTGRAGIKGTAASLVTRDDRGKLRDIQKLTGRTYQFETIEGLEPSENPKVIKFPSRSPKKPYQGKRKPGGKKSDHFKPSRRRSGSRGSGTPAIPGSGVVFAFHAPGRS